MLELVSTCVMTTNPLYNGKNRKIAILCVESEHRSLSTAFVYTFICIVLPSWSTMMTLNVYFSLMFEKQKQIGSY